MAGNSLLRRAYAGHTVVITGHTGFKGAWLSEWLLMLGARVVGIAQPPRERALFTALGLEPRLQHHMIDIRDADALKRCILDAAPDYVFHLAAQSLVRPAFGDPVATLSTNIMGTAHVVDTLRALDQRYGGTHRACAAVLATSDKCYAQHGADQPFHEDHPLGGYDPYSASKAAAEIVIDAYRASFLRRDGGKVSVASVRAGNVIGGGDWAPERILPDCIRNLERGAAIPVRNPEATRPWQHVLEPLGGYLTLAARQHQALQDGDAEASRALASAFNFGPEAGANQRVRELVTELLRHWPGEWTHQAETSAPQEAENLAIDWSKAEQVLGWSPRWGFSEAVARTALWYRRHVVEGTDALELTRGDINAYGS